ncbi:hypothetical protein [Zavarzinella formosa]|uniref:hypothetical protein n=1 Tax=Zavarzinella formosa TaxID=360055 RepID=UPI0002E58AAC|nr:hypothetical protein [Zavarzinella formosa]
MRTLLTSAMLIVGLLCVSATPAFAAKGVKKKPQNGIHHIRGVVVQVHHHPKATSAGHIGEITVKTHHRKKKSGSAAKGAKVSGHIHKLSVGSNTKFSSHKGKLKTPASFAAVHRGEHVMISAKGGHAEAVAILHHGKR